MARYVYTVDVTYEGCVGVFSSVSKAAKYVREKYKISFPSGSISGLKDEGRKISVKPKWAKNDIYETCVVLTRREVL